MDIEWFRKALLLLSLIGSAALQDVPEPPQLVNVSCGVRQAVVHWQPAERSDRPVTAFYVQHSNSHSPYTWETVLPKIPANETRHTVDLSPWMNYTFRVVASNHIGPSRPSGVSPVCSTPPDVPYRNPENVKGEGNQPDNIVITWDAMHEPEHNGPGFVYRVYWKRDDPEEQWSSADIYDWRLNQMVIPDQPTFSRYRIKIAALNQVGEASPPQEVIGYSGEGVPTQAPRNLKILYLTNDKVVISWDSVEENSLQGRHNGYKILVLPDGGDELSVQEVKTSPSITRAHMAVPPGTTLHVRVFARNGRFTGPPSDILTFHTPEGVPGPVQSFEAYPLGSSSFYLTWRRPYISNGVLTGYKIHYQVITGITVGEKMQRPSLVPIQQTRAKLSGLQPNTMYRVYITAITKSSEGIPYSIEHRTGPTTTAKPDVPHFYWLQERLVSGVASVRVVWLPDVEGHPGSHFFVKRRMKGQTEFSATDPEFDEDFLIVSGMDPCRTYEFQLVAVDGAWTTGSAVKDVTVDAAVECDVAENELE